MDYRHVNNNNNNKCNINHQEVSCLHKCMEWLVEEAVTLIICQRG